MLAKIIQLDKHVAELIAAGEVVERPASVVKELVENCIDAGASTVTVEIKRGGLELIRVSDNGSGIGADDIRAAFLRHATSKIRTADDLNSIMTMGFRGEALASIASVSKVTVFTRTPEATAGLCYEIEGGQEKSLEEAGCPAGTTILVKELFYNTPARMKFIKKDIAEAGQVQTVVRRAALARPDISFKLIKDGEELLHTPGDHSLISAVYCVYGGPFAAGFEKAGAEHEGVRVFGYVSKPVYSQGNRTKQEFFVNARPVRSRILSAALEEAYKNRLMANRYPACVLNIEITPSVLDVNVHPAKSEIKFAFERQVFDAVYLAVKDAIDKEDARAEITPVIKPPQFSQPSKEEYVQTSFHASEPAQRDFFSSMTAESYRDAYRKPDSPQEYQYKPYSAPYKNDNVASGLSSQSESQPSSRYELTPLNTNIVGKSELPDPGSAVKPTGKEQESAPLWKIVGEAFDAYIIVEDGDDILFIDKHAAHERIIFERLSAEGEKPLTQLLIDPAVLQFERGELEVLLSNKELLEGMGFEFEPFGGENIILRGLPGEVDRSDAAASLQEIAESLAEHRRSPLTQRREEALRLVACKAAVKAGSVSSYAEKYALVSRVMAFDDIKYCPHGRPVAAVLKKYELEKRFGRT